MTTTTTKTSRRSRGSIPDSIIFGHDRGGPLALGTAHATTLRTGAASSAAARVAAAVVVWHAVKAAVNVVLALAGLTVFAEATPLAALHEPDRVLDELHRRAEDGRGALRAGVLWPQVGGTVEVGVRARVGRVRDRARLVQPEGVTLWEFQEPPWWRGVEALAQHPVAEVWSYFVHPQAMEVMPGPY